MKTFEVRITGSGTKNQVEISLNTILRELQQISDQELSDRNDTAPFYEDEVLCASIEEE